jgi:hypothetical protein
MKMKIYKKIKRYDLALKEANFAVSLMNEKQLEKHSELKTYTKELKVIIFYFD